VTTSEGMTGIEPYLAGAGEPFGNENQAYKRLFKSRCDVTAIGKLIVSPGSAIFTGSRSPLLE
jgi:hypothetical protein